MQSLASRLATSERRAWPDEPVPIGLAITDLDPGGAEKALVAIATRLDRSRWHPTFVNLGPEAALCRVLREANIPVHSLDLSSRRPAEGVAKLAKAFRKLRPRLIQSFLFHANVASKLASGLTGRPWIVGGLRVAEREKRWHLAIERRTQRMSSGWICVSEGVRRHAVEVGGLRPDRLVVIPNGVDPAPFDQASPASIEGLGSRAEFKILLFVGRLTFQKNVSLLLEGFAEFAGSHPDWELWIVGDGPDRPMCEARVERDPTLRGRVAVLGRRDDVPSLMKAADLLALTSRWEGMPNVVLEAMAARLPVVSTRVEGIEELIGPVAGERAGWLIPSEDPSACASTLREAASSIGVDDAVAAVARRRVEQRHGWPAIVRAYERVWAGLLGLALDDPSEVGANLRSSGPSIRTDEAR